MAQLKVYDEKQFYDNKGFIVQLSLFLVLEASSAACQLDLSYYYCVIGSKCARRNWLLRCGTTEGLRREMS